MEPRLNAYQAAPEAMKALVAFENYVQQSGLDHSLIDLVKTRRQIGKAQPEDQSTAAASVGPVAHRRRQVDDD